MRLLVTHQNFPGQFGHLVGSWNQRPGWDVRALARDTAPGLPGFDKLTRYTLARKGNPNQHPYLRQMEDATLHGQAAVRSMLQLRRSGFTPDAILAHPGWGETLYAKDVFPDARLIHLCEWFYNPSGADLGFDPEFPVTLDDRTRIRAWNALHTLNLTNCDIGIAPTHWQRLQHPPAFLHKIRVQHEGINTHLLTPDPKAAVRTSSGAVLRAGDPVVTYVARNLEPYRGFHLFMRALEKIQAQHKTCHAIIVGGDGVSYGKRPKDAATWREQMQREVKLDPTRTHFVSRLPHAKYLRVLQVSAAHVYLTYPFVLSWSLLEAMGCGVPIIGSDTAPVREVIRDGVNGRLVPFFDAERTAQVAVEMMQTRREQVPMRKRARVGAQAFSFEAGSAGYERAISLALSEPAAAPGTIEPIEPSFQTSTSAFPDTAIQRRRRRSHTARRPHRRDQPPGARTAAPAQRRPLHQGDRRPAQPQPGDSAEPTFSPVPEARRGQAHRSGGQGHRTQAVGRGFVTLGRSGDEDRDTFRTNVLLRLGGLAGQAAGIWFGYGGGLHLALHQAVAMPTRRFEMLTGTPLDLTPFGSLLSGMGTAYWAVALLCAGLAAWFIREWPAKVVATLLILGGFALPVVLHVKKQGQEYDAAMEKLDKSMALFQERCKTAGEKIHRTVENVEGVVWMKWRDKRSVEDEHDQFKLTDPYGPACSDGDCLRLLLRATLGLEIDPKRQMPFYRGYAFVEAVDPMDGGRYRYVMRLRSGNLDHQELEKKSIQAWSASFGITWDDISTREDREHWIAGSSLRVIDLQTSEVIAERTGYMIDRGQGSRSGFRTPWLMAERTACPAFDVSESGNPSRWSRSQGFVLRALHPSKDQ